VALNRFIVARLTKRDLGKSSFSSFTKGKLIEAKVKAVDQTAKDKPRVDLTLKSKKLKKPLKLDDLKEGMKLKGHIKSVKAKGLTICIRKSKNLQGFCPISELSDDFVSNPSKFYKEGDLVKALVINVDQRKKRLVLSLKPSHFECDVNSSDEKEDKKKIKRSSGESSEPNLQRARTEKAEEAEDENEGEEEEDMEIEGLAPVGFDWEEAVQPQSKDLKRKRENTEKVDEDGLKVNEEEMDIEQKKSKKKRAKKAQQLAEEEEIRAKEEELLAEALPKTADDYEKLLLASPNSSFLWIKYMAFQLSIAEIEKAREIAERALKRINFREEQEKLNIWVALMNLENKHGTNESLMQVFQRALTFNDPKTVYLQLVSIYERTEQHKLAEELYKAMTKKFKQSWQIWLRYAQFHLKSLYSIEGARKVLERALQALPKSKHIEVISKMAQIEFKHGSPERGRTIFEGILSNYPKRVDIWGVYMDMELKLGDHTAIRNLFEKATTLQLSSKKMRYFFERYLKFEKEHGTKETVSHVREKARQYVLSKS